VCKVPKVINVQDAKTRKSGNPRVLPPNPEAEGRVAQVSAPKNWGTSYRAFAEVSENLASRDLKMLVDKRVLVPAGERRGRYYQASPELLEIGKKIFQPFKMDDEPFKSKPQQGVLPGIE
jgi:hypothetical protein